MQQTLDQTGQEREDYRLAKINSMFAELYANTTTVPTTTKIALGAGTGTMFSDGRLTTDLSVAGVGNGADTTEDTLFTRTLAANSLSANGQFVEIEAWGSVAATSATKTVRVYFGAQLITLTYTTTQTGNWRARFKVVRQAASVQLILGEADAVGATTARVLANITNGAEDTTAAIVIKVTGQSSVGTANLILANGMTILGSN